MVSRPNDYRGAIRQLCIGGCADGEYHASPDNSLTVRNQHAGVDHYRREHIRFPDGRTLQLWLPRGMLLYDGIRELILRYQPKGEPL